MQVLSLITFLPLAGAVSLLFVPKDNKFVMRVISALTAGIVLVLSLWLWVNFDRAIGDFQYIERWDWIPAFGIQYLMGVDGLSLPMILLTALLSLLAIFGSFHIDKRVKEYFFFFLLLETAMLGVFLALDFFLFYVFWELTLVPMYFLIGIWGGPRKEYAAIKFFLFTLFGSLFMLVAILAVYFASDPHTFDFMQLLAQNARFARGFQFWVFIGFFIGFAIKIPIVPFHTWLPLAHVEAPTAVSVILAGVLLKMGLYGLMRFSFPLLPVATHDLIYVIAIIAVINIVYGSFVSLAQTDMKRMIAYSSINHMGYAMLGMVALNHIGFSGAILQMVNHGIITGCLFLLVGVLYDQAHTRDMNAFGGLGTKVPVYTGVMIMACMASLGIPTLAGFVSEFLCFLGAFQVPEYRVLVGISLIGLLVTAGFFLIMIKRVFLGPLNVKWESLKDMNSRELVATIPLVILMVVLGIFPSLALKPMDATISHLLELIKLP